jgi:uncharacterized DUF497 family protein
MDFDWNETKRRSNLDKHGIDFVDAAEVIAGSPVIVESPTPGSDASRCIAYGELHGVLLAVVFTLREGTFWIISARPASRRERKRYAEA